MRLRLFLSILISSLPALLATPALSGSGLRVSPVILSMSAPKMTTTLNLENTGKETINVQARIFSWSQPGGEERLERTRDFVISPPIVKLAPGARQTVRVLRISKKPLAGVETARILVDQLPNRRAGTPGQVSFVVRQSIPVFFGSREARAADLRVSVVLAGSRMVVRAENAGEQPIRIAAPVLEVAGAKAELAPGLLGYVLGGSTVEWRLVRPRGVAPGSGALTYRSAAGTVSVPVTVRPGG